MSWTASSNFIQWFFAATHQQTDRIERRREQKKKIRTHTIRNPKCSSTAALKPRQRPNTHTCEQLNQERASEKFFGGKDKTTETKATNFELRYTVAPEKEKPIRWELNIVSIVFWALTAGFKSAVPYCAASCRAYLVRAVCECEFACNDQFTKARTNSNASQNRTQQRFGTSIEIGRLYQRPSSVWHTVEVTSWPLERFCLNFDYESFDRFILSNERVFPIVFFFSFLFCVRSETLSQIENANNSVIFVLSVAHSWFACGFIIRKLKK